MIQAGDGRRGIASRWMRSIGVEPGVKVEAAQSHPRTASSPAPGREQILLYRQGAPPEPPATPQGPEKLVPHYSSQCLAPHYSSQCRLDYSAPASHLASEPLRCAPKPLPEAPASLHQSSDALPKRGGRD